MSWFFIANLYFIFSRTILRISLMFVLASTILILQGVEAEFFSAVTELNSLLETHGTVIENIQDYLTNEEQRLKIIKSVLENYKKEHNKMVAERNYNENPLNAFLLIKRLTLDLEIAEYYITSVHTTYHKVPQMSLPTKEDFEGAGTALLRVQKTYNLNVGQLAQGILRGTYKQGNEPYYERTSPLQPNDIFEIGTRAYLENDYGNSVTWLIEALNKLKSKPYNEIKNFGKGGSTIVDWIRTAYYNLGDIENATIWTKRLLTLKPRNKDAKQKLIELGKLKKQPAATYQDKDITINLYHALCRGEKQLPHIVTKSLHCFYKSGPEPFLKLARIRSEQLYASPEVMLFHGVISDHEILILMELSKKKLNRAAVVDNKKLIPTLYRICKSAFFGDKHSPVVARLTQRMADFTELSVETAEPIQVANYGIGGHYNPHFDFFGVDHGLKEGDRIGTVLFYLSDVELGGGTVFTEFGLTVFPIKNSAIYFQSLNSSGEPDLRTRHGACPVLRGSKWVANKWFHAVGQEFRKPCPSTHGSAQNLL